MVLDQVVGHQADGDTAQKDKKYAHDGSPGGSGWEIPYRDLRGDPENRPMPVKSSLLEPTTLVVIPQSPQ
jgi:hypothetical protein